MSAFISYSSLSVFDIANYSNRREPDPIVDLVKNTWTCSEHSHKKYACVNAQVMIFFLMIPSSYRENKDTSGLVHFSSENIANNVSISHTYP